MVVNIFNVVQVSNVEGDYRVSIVSFPTWEDAKEHFNEKVKSDKKDLEENGRAVHNLEDSEFDQKVEDGDYVIEEDESSYMSYKYGYFSLDFVDIFIKETSMEVKV